jgi:hypothetical protein
VHERPCRASSIVATGESTGQLAVAAALTAGMFVGTGTAGALPQGQAAAADPVACASIENAAVFRLYRAYFLRDPDTAGHAYWEEVLTSGRSDLAGVSHLFASSPEFDDRYDALDDSDFIDLIYTNVMSREPDAGGHDYWTDLLAREVIGRGDLMLNFSESFEFRDQTAIHPSPPPAGAPQTLLRRVPVTLPSGHIAERSTDPVTADVSFASVSRDYPDTLDFDEIREFTRRQMQCAGWTVTFDGPVGGTVIQNWRFRVDGPNGLAMTLYSATGFGAGGNGTHALVISVGYDE